MSEWKARRRYRVIPAEFWDWRQFRTLPAVPKLVLLHLLTGPHATLVPGLFGVGAAALAESLNLSLSDYRAACAELVSFGMLRVDWDNRLVYVPDAWRLDPPTSPSQVQGWLPHLSALQDCELLRFALRELQVRLHEASAELGQAGNTLVKSLRLEPPPQRDEAALPLREGPADPPGEGPPCGGVPPGGHQEQEQEQEQQQDQQKSPAVADAPAAPRLTLVPPSLAKPKKPTAEQAECRRTISRRIDELQRELTNGHPFEWSAKERAAVVKLAARDNGGGTDPAPALELIETFARRMRTDGFYFKNFRPSFIESRVNELRMPLQKTAGTNRTPRGSSAPPASPDYFITAGDADGRVELPIPAAHHQAS